MIINTAPTERFPLPRTIRPQLRPLRHCIALALLVLGCATSTVRAGTQVGPWVPIFKGVDRTSGTNTPGSGGFTNLQVIRAIRVDLTDPDIHFFTTPRATNYQADVAETGGMKPNQFATNYNLNVVINANFFAPNNDYNFPQGTPMDLSGLLICTGQVVSAQEQNLQSDGTYGSAATFLFTSNNAARFIPTNWPATSTVGTYTAVSGDYPLLISNTIVAYVYTNAYYQGGGPNYPVHQLNPRTAYGLSADRHYLYLMTLDGRQSGYSDGSYDWETARWMQLLGAADAANMDGGGSTTLIQMSSTGVPVMLNNSSSVAAYGYQRTIGSVFGLTAKPLPGFINNITVNPDDTAASLTWTTTSPADGLVQYGLTTNLGSSTPLFSPLVTNHSVLLTNLLPGNIYYYKILSTAAGTQYASSNYYFLTTNYFTSHQAFDVTNSWTWTDANLDGINWTAKSYNDTGWLGSGPGLLWVYSKGTPNSLVQPRNTQLAFNPATVYPYYTYYFRTHFNIPVSPSSVSLTLSNYVDDGAVFYLNGAELYRLRMPAAPAVIVNSTLAPTYPCSGDATCPDVFSVIGVTNLLAGDNVLAAEVHNYNVASPDITFGSALTYNIAFSVRPTLNLATAGGTATLSWTRGGFLLQQASTPNGPWSAVPGPVVSSPYVLTNFPGTLFYRLGR